MYCQRQDVAEAQGLDHENEIVARELSYSCTIKYNQRDAYGEADEGSDGDAKFVELDYLGLLEAGQESDAGRGEQDLEGEGQVDPFNESISIVLLD